MKVSFDKRDLSKKVVRFNNIPGEMSGMVIGKRKINLKGNFYFID
jgi:hypothetical protein